MRTTSNFVVVDVQIYIQHLHNTQPDHARGSSCSGCCSNLIVVVVVVVILLLLLLLLLSRSTSSMCKKQLDRAIKLVLY